MDSGAAIDFVQALAVQHTDPRGRALDDSQAAESDFVYGLLPLETSAPLPIRFEQLAPDDQLFTSPRWNTPYARGQRVEASLQAREPLPTAGASAFPAAPLDGVGLSHSSGAEASTASFVGETPTGSSSGAYFSSPRTRQHLASAMHAQQYVKVSLEATSPSCGIASQISSRAYPLSLPINTSSAHEAAASPPSSVASTPTAQSGDADSAPASRLLGVSESAGGAGASLATAPRYEPERSTALYPSGQSKNSTVAAAVTLLDAVALGRHLESSTTITISPSLRGSAPQQQQQQLRPDAHSSLPSLSLPAPVLRRDTEKRRGCASIAATASAAASSAAAAAVVVVSTFAAHVVDSELISPVGHGGGVGIDIKGSGSGGFLHALPPKAWLLQVDATEAGAASDSASANTAVSHTQQLQQQHEALAHARANATAVQQHAAPLSHHIEAVLRQHAGGIASSSSSSYGSSQGLSSAPAKLRSACSRYLPSSSSAAATAAAAESAVVMMRPSSQLGAAPDCSHNDDDDDPLLLRPAAAAAHRLEEMMMMARNSSGGGTEAFSRAGGGQYEQQLQQQLGPAMQIMQSSRGVDDERMNSRAGASGAAFPPHQRSDAPPLLSTSRRGRDGDDDEEEEVRMIPSSSSSVRAPAATATAAAASMASRPSATSLLTSSGSASLTPSTSLSSSFFLEDYAECDEYRVDGESGGPNDSVDSASNNANNYAPPFFFEHDFSGSGSIGAVEGKSAASAAAAAAGRSSHRTDDGFRVSELNAAAAAAAAAAEDGAGFSHGANAAGMQMHHRAHAAAAAMGGEGEGALHVMTSKSSNSLDIGEPAPSTSRAFAHSYSRNGHTTAAAPSRPYASSSSAWGGGGGSTAAASAATGPHYAYHSSLSALDGLQQQQQQQQQQSISMRKRPPTASPPVSNKAAKRASSKRVKQAAAAVATTFAASFFSSAIAAGSSSLSAAGAGSAASPEYPDVDDALPLRGPDGALLRFADGMMNRRTWVGVSFVARLRKYR